MGTFLIVCWAICIILFPFSLYYQWHTKRVKFELEFYKRCHKAGLGDTVKTESEIQKAAEIVQKMAEEPAFSMEVKKRYLQEKWLNKRLCNGKQLLEQENEKRKKAEEERRKAEEELRKVKEERQKAEEAKWQKAEKEYATLVHDLSCVDGDCKLWRDRIQFSVKKRGNDENASVNFSISSLTDVILNTHCESYSIFICIGDRSESIFPGHGSVFYNYKQTPEEMLAIYKYLVKYSAMPEELKSMILRDPKNGLTLNYYLNRDIVMGTSHPVSYSNKSDKDASVVGRAAAGWVIGGPAGGVIGALSAVDKNNRRGRK